MANETRCGGPTTRVGAITIIYTVPPPHVQIYSVTQKNKKKKIV